MTADTTRMGTGEAIWIGGGSLILAAGTAVAAVYMFRGNVLAVVLGIFITVLGYQTIHFGVHDGSIVAEVTPQPGGLPSHEQLRNWTTNAVLLSLSIFLIGQGFAIGAQATASPGILDMMLCGAYIVGGYVLGHYAVHEEIL